MHVPAAIADDLYHKQGLFELSNKQNAAFVNDEQIKEAAHPVPVVLQPARYVLQAASDEALMLSVH